MVQAAAKQRDDKDAVDEGENSIVNTKKWNQKKFDRLPRRSAAARAGHFQRVEHADYDVLAPEQKHERKNFPAKKQHAHDRHEVGEDKRDDGRLPPVARGDGAEEFHTAFLTATPACRK